jgi:hypothetical protein
VAKSRDSAFGFELLDWEGASHTSLLFAPTLKPHSLTHSLATTTCFIMTPKYTAVTLGTVETDDDRKLNLWTAEAKFDLTPFISDGDVVDKEIQELDARLARAKAELERMRSGDLSHPVVRAQYEAKMLEQQVQIYLQSEEELHQKELELDVSLSSARALYKAIDPDLLDGQAPPTDLSDLQQLAGSVGLRKKAEEHDRVISWLQGIGGEDTVQHAVKKLSSVQPLLDKIGGEAQLDRLLKVVEEAGDLSALEANVAQAKAASSLLELLKNGEADKLFQLVSDSGGVDGLSKLMAQARAASSLTDKPENDGAGNLLW